MNLSAKGEGKDYSTIPQNPNSASNRSENMVWYQHKFRNRNQLGKRSITDDCMYILCSFYQANQSPMPAKEKF